MSRLLYLFALILFSLSPAMAQQQPSSPEKSGQAQAAQSAAQTKPASEAAEHAAGPAESHATAADDKKEGSGSEDVEEKMKQSASVQWIGRSLGISTQKAYWLSVGLNFAVIAFFIGMLLRSNMPRIFRERTGSIQKQMEEARRASAEASSRLSDIEARLARLDTQISEMRSTAEREAAAEEERLRAATEAERRRIVESAEQEITAISTNARRELKQFAAELAVNVATQRIRVDDATDRELVHNFGSQLNDGSKGGD